MFSSAIEPTNVFTSKTQNIQYFIDFQTRSKIEKKSLKMQRLRVLFTKRDAFWSKSAVEWSEFGKSKQKQKWRGIQIA